MILKYTQVVPPYVKRGPVNFVTGDYVFLHLHVMFASLLFHLNTFFILIWVMSHNMFQLRFHTSADILYVEINKISQYSTIDSREPIRT